jgi:hypothetical protein
VLVGGRSNRRMMSARKTTAVAVIAAFLVVGAGVALAADPGTDFRVSTVGFDGETRQGAFNPAVAYNSMSNEYLVVWYGDPDTRFEYEIWGQRLNATNGEPVSQPIRISNVGTDGDSIRFAIDPAVAYDPLSNRYLVVWYANQQLFAGNPPGADIEIWGQALAGNGIEIGSDFQISSTGPIDSNQARVPVRPPSVAFNEAAGQYLVVWSGNPNIAQNFNHYDIYGQIVSNSGTEVGTDIPISEVGTNAPFDRSAFYPDVAYNKIDNEYTVIWYANDLPNTFEYEIFGQRINAAGAQVGLDDFRISNVGADDDGLRDTGNSPPSIAYNSVDNEYLVTWYGDGLTTDDDYEIFGQRLNAAGDQIPGTADFRVSNEGPEGQRGFGAFDPATIYNPTDNEYLVTWYGNTGSEVEICGQRVSNAGEGKGSDFRISNTGTDGDSTRAAFFPDVAYNSSFAGPNEYLAVWYGDGLATDDEFEVFARRLGPSSTPCVTEVKSGGGGNTPPPAPAPNPPSPGVTTQKIKLTVSTASVQKALRAKAIVVRVTCDQACALTASTRLSVPGASKTFRLKSLKRSLLANRRATLKVKLSTKVIRAARRALAKRKTVRATVDLRTSNSGGLSKSTKRIRIKG